MKWISMRKYNFILVKTFKGNGQKYYERVLLLKEFLR
jgi:hypothetical protein